MFFIFLAESFAAEQPQVAVALMTGAIKTSADVDKMFSEPIARQLATGERNPTQWADELEKTTPTTPKELWTKFDVSVRAGHHETAIKLLPVLFDLSESIPTGPFGGKPDLSHRVYNAILESHATRQQRIELYIAFYDVFAPVYCHNLPTVGLKNAGWSSEKIADWLRKHYETALQHRPMRTSWTWGTFEHSRSSPYISDAALAWHEEYVKYIQRYDWDTNPFADDADWDRLANDAAGKGYRDYHNIETSELRLLWEKIYPITDDELNRRIIEANRDYAAIPYNANNCTFFRS
jgi:hypothetical protein